MANAKTISVQGEVKININTFTPLGNFHITLWNVIYVPEAAANLISIGSITKKGAKISFNSSNCTVKNLNNQIIILANIIKNGTYLVISKKYDNLNYSQQILSAHADLLLPNKPIIDMNTWHRRIDHLNYKNLKQLLNAAEGANFKIEAKKHCEPCIEGKQVKVSYLKSNSIATEIFELIHTDLCEADRTSIDGYKYFLVFYDDFSRMIFVYL